jgi:hypothetical protein
MSYKRIIKKAVSRLLLMIVLIAGLQLCLKAQPGDPTDPGTDPDLVPLDPGSWVLVAAGLGYGIKKWRDGNQKNTKQGFEKVADFVSERTDQTN